MTAPRPWKRWAVMWRSDNRTDGIQYRLQGEGGDLPLFRTRDECRAFIEERYGYIRQRPDLQAEPHGWKMPVAVRVQIAVTE